MKITSRAMKILIWITVALFVVSVFFLNQVDKHDFNHGKIDTLVAMQQSVVVQLEKLNAGELPPTEYRAERMRILGEQEVVLNSEIHRLKAHHAIYAQIEKRGFVSLALALGCAVEIWLNLRGKKSVTLIVGRILSNVMPFIRLQTIRVPVR